VYRTKRRFVLGDLEAALSEEPRPGAKRKLSGKEQALLVATACSKPPAGRARWTLELLAGELVRLTEHASISRETVRRRLAENDLKPWRKDMWCIPQVDAEYVARMEDVLDLYAEAPDPNRPVVLLRREPDPAHRRVRAPIQPETAARPPNPRECRRFSPTRKSHRRDRTGWLHQMNSCDPDVDHDEFVRLERRATRTWKAKEKAEQELKELFPK